MTAEVIVMNRLGIAMAADSAVTIGNAKTYSSAEKLYQLSETGPVGVMVYGNGTCLETPWETIIKGFRKHKAGGCCDTVQNYAEQFFNYLNTWSKSNFQYTKKFQENFVREYSTFYILKILNQAKKKAEGAEKKGGYRNILAELIRTEISEEFRNSKDSESTQTYEWSSDFDKELMQAYGNIIDDAFKEAGKQVDDEYKMAEDLLPIYRELIIDSFKKKDLSHPQQSGLVFAGFGEKEFFPRVFQVIFRGMVNNRSLHYFDKKWEINADSPAWIIPFAQIEMVYTFLYGIHPQLHSVLDVSTRELIIEMARAILNKVKENAAEYGQELEKEINPKIAELCDKHARELNDVIMEYFLYPIWAAVASLPKVELAAMAESLVNLTKFKRHVSKEQETVGGPIDVAVLTKGDGFVWVKRKHYFDPELNPRLISRLYLGRRGDQNVGA